MSEAVELPAPRLTEDELQFVTLVDQFFNVHGRMLSEKDALEHYEMPVKYYHKHLSKPLVEAAIRERGVSLAEYAKVSGKVIPIKEAWKHKSLSPVQLQVANIMLDLIDTRSQKKKLQDCGVSTQQYAKWMKDPVFQSYLRQRAESLLGDNQHEAHLALLDRVRTGDLRAISYYNEMTGYYVPVANRGTGGSTAVDVNNLIVKIIEIIDEEVHDQQTALRIADRFKAMITARNIAGELLSSDEPIEVPEIAKSRVVTDDMKKLMSKGEHYETQRESE